jgi:DNA-binding beta-propeller fold protein YncE
MPLRRKDVIVGRNDTLRLCDFAREFDRIALVNSILPHGDESKVLPNRRQFCQAIAASLPILAQAGCAPGEEGAYQPDKIWGRIGITDGRFQKPRAMAIDRYDRLYIVDMTARIQVFDVDGNFIRTWSTPVHDNGRPTGLTIDHDGNLLVADTHYFRILCYTPEGRLLEDKTLGGTMGDRPGEFGLVTDAVRDSQGNIYVSEYGEWDRIQKFSPDREFLVQWGGHGDAPGQFLRPQNMEIDGDNRIWVADACNHRIQVFDTKGNLELLWGEEGTAVGQLSYPYDLTLDGEGHVYVCEYGNHRVQKFTLDGRSVAVWGRNGRRPGELHNPWALVRDSQGRIHVLDSNNHRVQKFVM